MKENEYLVFKEANRTTYTKLYDWRESKGVCSFIQIVIIHGYKKEVEYIRRGPGMYNYKEPNLDIRGEKINSEEYRKQLIIYNLKKNSPEANIDESLAEKVSKIPFTENIMVQYIKKDKCFIFTLEIKDNKSIISFNKFLDKDAVPLYITNIEKLDELLESEEENLDKVIEKALKLAEDDKR